MKFEVGYAIGAAVVLVLLWIARRVDRHRHQAELDRIQQRLEQRKTRGQGG